jgi:hypothetical protein
VRRGRVVEVLRAALEPLAFVNAAGWGGSDAFGRADELPDVDLQVDVDDGQGEAPRLLERVHRLVEPTLPATSSAQPGNALDRRDRSAGREVRCRAGQVLLGLPPCPMPHQHAPVVHPTFPRELADPANMTDTASAAMYRRYASSLVANTTSALFSHRQPSSAPQAPQASPGRGGRPRTTRGPSPTLPATGLRDRLQEAARSRSRHRSSCADSTAQSNEAGSGKSTPGFRCNPPTSCWTRSISPSIDDRGPWLMPASC